MEFTNTIQPKKNLVVRIKQSFSEEKSKWLGIISLVVLILGIPLGVWLAQTSQIFAPRAAVIPIELVSDECVLSTDPNKVSCVSFPIKLTSPLGPALTVSSCTSDADCASGNKCFKHQSYPGACRPIDTQCAQVITEACSPEILASTGQVQCAQFPTPCHVPPGWIIQGSNRSPAPSPSPSSSPAPSASPSPSAAPVVCKPRPNIGRLATMGANGMTVTLTAATNSNTPTNPMSEIQFTSLVNGTVTINNQVKTAAFTHPVPDRESTGINPVTFLIKQVTYGQPTTIFLKVKDTCGLYDLFFGGGVDAKWPVPAGASPAPSPAPSTAPVSCNPRPNVTVATSKIGGGQIQVNVTANTNTGTAPANTVKQINFTSPNTTIKFGNEAVKTGNFTQAINSATTSFIVKEVTQGQGGTANFVVVDGCGNWNSLAGGGAGSYTYNASPSEELDLAFGRIRNQIASIDKVLTDFVSLMKTVFIKPVYAVSMPTVTGTSVCAGDVPKVALTWNSDLNPDVLEWDLYREPPFVGFNNPSRVGNYTFPFVTPKVGRVEFPMLPQGDKGGTYTYWLGDGSTISNKITVTNNAICSNNSQLVEAVVPAQVQPGSQFNVKYVFKNTGTRTWPSSSFASYDSTFLKLVSNTAFTPTISELVKATVSGLNLDIYPGQSYTFEFSVTAPSVPGTYEFKWQLNNSKKSGFFDTNPTLTPFGEVSTKQVVVSGSVASPSPSPVASVAPSASPTPVASPSPSAAPVVCSPRPNIGRVATMGADGMTVTLTGATNSNTPTNPMSEIQFTTFDNGTVTINNQVKTAAFTHPVPAGTSSVTFLIKQVIYGQPTTIRLVVKDTCEPYNLFFGGGVDARWPTPAPSPALPGTLYYRIAESEAGLVTASQIPYGNYPTITNFTFSNQNPGSKQIWVQFIGPNGATSTEHIVVDLVEIKPVITSLDCSMDISGKDLKLTLQGEKLGGTPGKISGNSKEAQILSWTGNQVTATLKPDENLEDGKLFKVVLTLADGRVLPENTCLVNTTLVSLGARLFCREPGKFDVNGVKILLVDESGNKVNEEVTVDKDGFIKGLKTKLQVGKRYAISVKAPYSIRRNAEFIASNGTNIIAPEDDQTFVLPVGDIAPTILPDGKINTLDRSEIVRQWSILGVGTNKTGDFNRDTRVNSIDWACMRYDFNKEDDLVPAKAVLPSPSLSPDPSILRCNSSAQNTGCPQGYVCEPYCPPGTNQENCSLTAGRCVVLACPTPPVCPVDKILTHGDSIGSGCPAYRCVNKPVSDRVAFFLFVPDAPGLYSLNSEFGVDLNIWSTNEAANLFVAKIAYDNSALEVVGLGKLGSFNWTENVFNNQTGLISLVAGVPSPGLKTTGDAGSRVIRIIFKGKKLGVTNLDIMSEASRIFANSDNANILREPIIQQIEIKQ